MRDDRVYVADLQDFIARLYNVKNETEGSDLINATPDSFKNPMFEFIIEELPPLKWESLRVQIRKKTGEIIRLILNDEQAIREAISFNDWLDSIPLIPKEVIDKLKDDYRRACMEYENFSDCYNGFDKKSFFDEAKNILSRWMSHKFLI